MGAAPHLLRIAILAAMFTLPVQVSYAAGSAGIYKIFGVGSQSCGQWAAYKATDRLTYYAMSNWLEGFVSAVNAYSWSGNNVASETDTRGMTAWVDSYCVAHPASNFGTAAEALVSFLQSGPHPNDK